MAKKAAKKSGAKTVKKSAAGKTKLSAASGTKKASKKASKKAAPKKSTAKSKKSTTAKSSGIQSRARYAESLQKKVVSAIKKGMTHLEASKAFEVGFHSIPKWIKKHT